MSNKFGFSAMSVDPVTGVEYWGVIVFNAPDGTKLINDVFYQPSDELFYAQLQVDGIQPGEKVGMWANTTYDALSDEVNEAFESGFMLAEYKALVERVAARKRQS